MDSPEDAAGDAAAPLPESLKLPLVWMDSDAPAVLYANQFALQRSGGDLFLAVGQLVPPLLLGSQEEQRDQLKQLSFVPVRIVGRYLVTLGEMRELADLLKRHLERFPAEGDDQALGDS